MADARAGEARIAVPQALAGADDAAPPFAPAAAHDTIVRPPPRVAWTSALLLMLLFAFAYLDRQVIALMVHPIRATFGIGDFEVSLLQGFAFALLYALAGLPLGMAVDRHPRRYIVLGGVLVWSVAAIASGLAQTYWQLLLARIMVGAGEAALAPAAYSLLADLFPRRRLTFALGVFMIGATLGAEGSLALGGFILRAAEGGVTLPLFGTLEAWRFAFVVTGLPGIAFAFLALAIHEPVRPPHPPEASRWREVFAFMAARRRFFAAHLIGFSLVMALVYARLAWNPTFLMRHFGWTVAEAGYALGAFGMVTGPIALLGGGRLVDALFARGYRDAHLRYYVWGGGLIGLFGIATYLVPSPALFFLCSLAIIVPLNMGAIGASAIQIVTPPHLRGRVSAIYLLSVALLGMSLGPALVGFLTQHVLKDEQAIHVALAISFGALGTAATLMFLSGLRPMREAAARADSN